MKCLRSPHVYSCSSTALSTRCPMSVMSSVARCSVSFESRSGSQPSDGYDTERRTDGEHRKRIPPSDESGDDRNELNRYGGKKKANRCLQGERRTDCVRGNDPCHER